MDVILRKWTMEDRAAMADICHNINRENLSDRLPYPYTEKDSREYIEFLLQHDETDGVFRAVVRDGAVVGTISVEQKSDVFRVDCEIGYMLKAEYHNKGVMTEAVKEICRTAFEKLPVERITGYVYAGNTPSRRVLEKNGFVCEGIMKNAAVKNGQLRDVCIYGKVK